MLFCKQSFFLKTFSFTFYINILYYICNVLPISMESVTKNLSMKECREEHNKLLNISYDYEVGIVCNEVQNLCY